ncbi:MAG: hypothetical protein ACT4PU_09720 [Planctomycetota bacterium]
MNRKLVCHILTLGLAFSAALPATAQTVTVPLGPKDGYLRLSANDSAVDATPVPLSSIGVFVGQTLRMRGLGDMDNGPSSDSILSLIGVFSANTILLPPSNQHRVPGAVEAGPDFVTSATLTGALPTDIPQDFRVATSAQPENLIEVPAGAAYLFVGNHESQWFDNSDPDGDLAVQLTVVGTWKDVGFALPGTAGPPTLTGTGLLLGGDAVTFSLASARPNANTWLIVGFSGLLAPFKGGTLVPNPDLLLGPFPTNGAGQVVLPGTWPSGLPEMVTLWFQMWIQDPAGPWGYAASNGVTCLTP